MGRTLWVVRHAEREDNINGGWQKKHPGMKPDNSPLSERGIKQANELCKRFANVTIDHAFCSPFDRTVETLTRIIGERNIPIKAEPGLAEALYLCEKPPSFWPAEKLKEKFPLVDTSYEPVCPTPLPKEGYGDDACIPRLRRALEGIFDRYPDGSILLVGHGASIGAIYEVLTGDWKYVGQATVTKFVEDDKVAGRWNLEISSDASHLSDKSNLRPW